MIPLAAILDTGAGADLTIKRALQMEWFERIKLVDDPGLIAATKQAVEIEGTILLHVRIGDLLIRVWTGVPTTLTVQLLVGTSFIDRFVKRIFPKKRQIVSQVSKPVAILTLLKGVLTVETDDAEEPTVDTKTVLHVARARQVPPSSQATVLVWTKGSSGLVFLTSHENIARSNLAMRAPGVMEIVSNRPFYVLVTKFRKNNITLPKGMLVARGARVSHHVVEVHPKEPTLLRQASDADTINTVH